MTNAGPDMQYIQQRPNGKYRVRLSIKGIEQHIGTYDTLEAAQIARNLAVSELRNQRVEAPARAVAQPGQEWPGWIAEGVTAAEPTVDPEAAYRKAVDLYKQTAGLEIRRLSQRLEFPFSPFCMVFTGDAHLGDAGTDIERVFYEAQIVNETPGMYLADVGDNINNFIQAWALKILLNTALTIGEQWALFMRWLRLVAPKLAIEVGGNHNAWSADLSGVDWFRVMVGSIVQHALYDAHDCRVVLAACGREWPIRIRHKWRGTSIYNVTQGIERAARFDDKDFVLGVAAHTHASGVTRQFNVGSTDCMAVLVGSYKKLDSFKREKGFPNANRSTAVAVIFDAETGSMTGCNDLEMAAKIMRRMLA